MDKSGTYKYIAATGADKVIATGKCILHRIIVGKDVASSVIEVSDHVSDGDGNVQLYLEGSTLSGVYEVEAHFSKGIAADLTNQTNVTFIYSPSN